MNSLEVTSEKSRNPGTLGTPGTLEDSAAEKGSWKMLGRLSRHAWQELPQAMAPYYSGAPSVQWESTLQRGRSPAHPRKIPRYTKIYQDCTSKIPSWLGLLSKVAAGIRLVVKFSFLIRLIWFLIAKLAAFGRWETFLTDSMVVHPRFVWWCTCWNICRISRFPLQFGGFCHSCCPDWSPLIHGKSICGYDIRIIHHI